MSKAENARDALGEVSIINPDEAWPAQFEAERRRSLPILGGRQVKAFRTSIVLQPRI